MVGKSLNPDQCADRLKSLADPDRLRLIAFLRMGSFSVGDLASELDMEIANVSHHLKVLKAGGLVYSEKQGRSRIYHLSPDALVENAPGCFDFGCCTFELKKFAPSRSNG